MKAETWEQNSKSNVGGKNQIPFINRLRYIAENLTSVRYRVRLTPDGRGLLVDFTRPTPLCTSTRLCLVYPPRSWQFLCPASGALPVSRDARMSRNLGNKRRSPLHAAAAAVMAPTATGMHGTPAVATRNSRGASLNMHGFHGAHGS